MCVFGARLAPDLSLLNTAFPMAPKRCGRTLEVSSSWNSRLDHRLRTSSPGTETSESGYRFSWRYLRGAASAGRRLSLTRCWNCGHPRTVAQVPWTPARSCGGSPQQRCTGPVRRHRLRNAGSATWPAPPPSPSSTSAAATRTDSRGKRAALQPRPQARANKTLAFA